jgi:signal transduction histidine kinase
VKGPAFPQAPPLWTLLEHPPRVRVEWIVAAARVMLATGALVAIGVGAQHGWLAAYLAAWYLAYSLAILVLVWSPVRFARSWDIGLHVLDLLAFSVLIVATSGASSPFFVSLLFLLICATIRWQHRGTLWTGAGAALAYGAASAYAAYVLARPGFDGHTFVIRVAYLIVMTILLGYLASHQRRFQSEISRLAAWPRNVSRDRLEVLSEILTRVADFMHAPRVVLAWMDPDDARINVAWCVNGEVFSKQEDDTAFGSLVLPHLQGRSFQTADAAAVPARIVSITPRGFLRRRCRPIDERFRARFGIQAVQSWPIDGEIVHGRLFCLDKSAMPLDDLVLGEFLARVATTRLDSFHLLDRLRAASALEARVRVARDLHDSLLQSQAGAALQLLAARRLLDRDVSAAKLRLHDIQQQLERGEMEMRSYIRGLRPIVQTPGSAKELGARLHELRQQIERQWTVGVEFTLEGSVDRVPPELGEQVYRLVQEGVVNAARHADASAISVDLSVDGSNVRLTIADDGKGFPFSGTYDLAALGHMNQGPVTLKERVAELRGDLTLTSEIDAGTRLSITVPCAQN